MMRSFRETALWTSLGNRGQDGTDPLTLLGPLPTFRRREEPLHATSRRSADLSLLVDGRARAGAGAGADRRPDDPFGSHRVVRPADGGRAPVRPEGAR